MIIIYEAKTTNMGPKVPLHVLLHKLWEDRLDGCCHHCGEIHTDDIIHTRENITTEAERYSHVNIPVAYSEPLEYSWSIPSTYRFIFWINDGRSIQQQLEGETQRTNNLNITVTNTNTIPSHNAPVERSIEFVFNCEDESDDEMDDMLDDLLDACNM